jgi:chemotaxis protein MotB
LQILPAGRGEYMPIDSNENADGRARNRRTEIIITPRLEKLINILK